MMRKRLAMVIDASKCLDCKACQAACKVANQVPEGFWRNWIKTRDLDFMAHRRERNIFQPGNCMHCNRPTCVQACPTGATYKDSGDGTVRINRKLCIGCGQCLPACPYGARYRHSELRVADKCDFCAERRAAGLEPACVSTCPTKTRVFGDLNDPDSEISRLLAENRSVRIFNPQTPTDPNIYYLGSPGPNDWPVEAQMPLPWLSWKTVVRPAVSALVGLSALGVGAMFLKQVLMPWDTPEDEHHRTSPSRSDQEGRNGGGHE